MLCPPASGLNVCAPACHFLAAAVCLRGLAAHDAACRAAAYQALALFEAQLPAAAAAPGFREAQQLR